MGHLELVFLKLDSHSSIMKLNKREEEMTEELESRREKLEKVRKIDEAKEKVKEI